VILTLFDFVLVLNALVRKSFELLRFNQTHNAALFSTKCETFPLHVRDTWFCWTLFSCWCRWNMVLFLPIYLCAFWFLFNLKFFLLLCK